MLIKDHNGHLEIKRTGDQEFPYLRIAATIQTSSGNFAGENNGVLFCGSEAGKARLQRLKAFQANEVLVDLTEGCSIEI